MIRYTEWHAAGTLRHSVTRQENVHRCTSSLMTKTFKWNIIKIMALILIIKYIIYLNAKYRVLCIKSRDHEITASLRNRELTGWEPLPQNGIYMIGKCFGLHFMCTILLSLCRKYPKQFQTTQSNIFGKAAQIYGSYCVWAYSCSPSYWQIKLVNVLKFITFTGIILNFIWPGFSFKYRTIKRAENNTKSNLFQSYHSNISKSIL